MTSTIAYINGQFGPIDEASIPIQADPLGTIRGLRVFTTSTCRGNQIFHIDDHIDRLFECTQFIKIKLPYTPQELKNLIQDALQKNRDHGISEDLILRVLVSAGKMNSNKEIDQPLIYITFEPMTAADKTKVDGVTLGTYAFQRSFPEIKFTNYVGGYLADLALSGRADQALFVSYHKPQKVLEGTTFSCFFVKGKQIFTPPLDGKILDGITRRIICQLIDKDPEYELVETDILVSEINQFEEVFITSSISRIVAVQKIDDIHYQLNGHATRKVKSLFNNYIEDYYA